ncbi:MAG: cupin domain-containing protein [Gemmatimonadetes bacterium]|nr:cupin domain-containing protein [Gemmatimonadota bacterium]
MRTRSTLAIGLATGAALALGARELPAFYGELIGTTVVKASQLRPMSARGETVQTYLEAPTSTLLNLGLRATTLDPGAAPNGRPNSRASEGLILVKEGTLEVKLDDKGARVEQLGPGSAIFMAPNQWHALRNATAQPVTFYEFDWISPGMNGEPDYPEAVVNRRRLPQP